MSRRSVGLVWVSRSTSAGSTHTSGDLVSDIRNRARLRDLLAVVALPAVLLSVYALPQSVKREFVLSYSDPTLLTAFTSHFVHFSPAHLSVNVVGSLLVVSLGYVLALAGTRRKQFFVVYLTFVLAFPFALSGLTLLWGWSGVGFGFSGIVLAFVGYLPLGLLSVLSSRFGLPVDQRDSHWLFLIAVAVAASIALPSPDRLALAAIAAGLTGAFAWQLSGKLDSTSLDRVRNTAASAGNLELVVLGVVVVLFYPFVAFSADPMVDGGVLNVYVHGLGLCLGYGVAYVGSVSGWLDFRSPSQV